MTGRALDDAEHARCGTGAELGADVAEGEVVLHRLSHVEVEIDALELQPPQALLDRVLANPKPVVALAALVVLLVIAVMSVLALRPKKKGQDVAALPARPHYPELPASAPMQAALQASYESQSDYDAMQQIEEQRKPVVLPPPPTSLEREQAMATVDQRPDAAVRVVRNWLRQ